MLETEYRDPRDLVDYDQNSRTHTSEQIEGIAAAIQRFGFNAQILLKDDGSTIGAGHARRAAACLLIERGIRIPRSPDGVKVPTAILRGLTETEWRAYVIADNQLALNAAWDEAALRRELAAIADAAADLTVLVGFDLSELDRLLAETAQQAPEEFPAFGEDIEVEHRCPKCGYAWSGTSEATGG